MYRWGEECVVFNKSWQNVLKTIGRGLLHWRYGDGIALGALAALACVGIYQITGSNRGLATVLGITCALTGRCLGWRAGIAAAAVATMAFDFVWIGERFKLFQGTTFNHVLIYVGFFAVAVIASPDVKLFPAAPSDDPPPAKRNGRQPCENGADNIHDAARGEAAAHMLLNQARPERRTYLITARLRDMVQGGNWTSYEAGFSHGLAMAAMPSDDLATADHDADNVDSDAWVVSADGKILPVETIRHEQIGCYKHSQN